jgi:hypothetical protein
MKTETKKIGKKEMVILSKSGTGETRSVGDIKDAVIIDNVETLLDTFETRVKKNEEFQERKRAAKAISSEAFLAVKIEERKWLESICKKIEPEFKKNGFMYKLVSRGEKALIYSQHNIENGITEDVAQAFEVFVSKISAPKIAFKKQYEAYEMFPGNGVFGIWAWSCSTLERAQIRFNALEKDDVEIEDAEIEEEEDDDVE